jgi:UDP-N-acetylmuramyl pentapeptide phosphotransferase/UDP-N-acetylglucosamine-1-phosphate transferase
MKIIIFGVIPFLFTYIGVEVFRRWSLRKNILDLPNERSSHTQPTPRGGGLVFVIIILLFVLFYFQSLSILPYFISAILIAIISWFDDIKHIPSGIRLLFHSFAACLIIYFYGYFETIFGIQLGIFGIVLTFLWIVWMINAYNFMDGIDGIAGMQAVTASFGWIFVFWSINSQNGLVFNLIYLSTVLGFLVHNWSPAKIFMGDVGSAFLGFNFAVLPLILLEKNDNQDLFLVTILFLWFFVFDTIWTFCRRLLKGEKVWEAHRSHLYQRLVISGFSHQFVTILYGVLSIIIVLIYIFLPIEKRFLIIPIILFSSIILLLLTVFYERRSRTQI